MEPLLKTRYKELVPVLLKQLGLRNIHQVPALEKIVINCSIGSQSDRKVAIDEAVHDLTLISGQKPIVASSRIAIANFKLRAGEPVGCKVTLRGNRMYDFMMRLIKTAMPRIRDFRGVSPRAFDGRGNYTLGISDQSIFPEIELDKIKRTLGYDITFVTTSNSDDHSRELLRAMGMPFREKALKADGKPEETTEAAAN
jgi:large subunit ribosomal protein L5